MENQLIKAFEASGGGSYTTFVLALLAALIGLGGTFLLLRRKVSREAHSRNIIIAMLLFFMFLIGSSTAFFSYLRLGKVGPVEIYSDHIVTPYGTAAFKDIRNAEIVVDKQGGVLNPEAGRRTRILTIIEKDGKTHALSETDYEVRAIMGSLKKAVKSWKEKEKK